MSQVLTSGFDVARVRRTVLSGAPPLFLAVASVQGLLTLGLVTGLPLDGPDDSLLSRVSVGAFVAGMTVLTMAGALVIRRRPLHPMGWWMAAAGLTAVFSRLLAGYAAAALGGQSPIPDIALWATNWIWVPAHVMALEMLLRFPGGRLPGRAWRIVEGAVLVWGVAASLCTALLPGPLGQTNLDHLDNPYGVTALEPVLTAALTPLFMVMPALSVLSVVALVWRWRASDAETRQQLRWVAAAATALALASPFAVLGGVPELAFGLAFLLLPAAISLAVLRHRLWELGILVRRSLVYAVCLGVLASGYVAAVASIDAAWTPLLAGLTVAGLAVPLRGFAERALQHWLFGAHGDPALVAGALARRLDASVEPVVDTVVDQLRRSLRLPYVALTGLAGAPLAASGTLPAGAPAAGTTRIPLSVRGRRVGWLVAAERLPGEGLGPRDVALLTQVAQPTGLAVHAGLLDADLRSSHQRLLIIRQQERARLQRDLHDGLGPTLGGITMRAEAARNLIRTGGSTAPVDDILAQIGGATETAVAEIRRLIDDLQPTPLELLGLHQALRETAQEATPDLPVDVHLPQVISLPLEVEVAVYRIAVEALRNARRHAGASRCSLRLDLHPAEVVLEVVDDGVGVRAATPGVGMTSMTARAAGLGGSVCITAADGGAGTKVQARIPVAPR